MVKASGRRHDDQQAFPRFLSSIYVRDDVCTAGRLKFEKNASEKSL
jgi:hypothetical protein